MKSTDRFRQSFLAFLKRTWTLSEYFHHLSWKSKTKLILMCMQQLQLSEDFFFHSTVICSHLHLEWRPEQAVQGNNVCCFASLICFMPKVILNKSLGQLLFHLKFGLASPPSSIYSCFLKPLSVLHSQFPTKKLWVVAYF